MQKKPSLTLKAEPMTIVLAIKTDEGIVVASDRMLINSKSNMKQHQQNKIEKLNNLNIIIGFTGNYDIYYTILSKFKKKIENDKSFICIQKIVYYFFFKQTNVNFCK